MSTIQGNLRSIAKDFDKAQEKIDKQRSKGERSDAGRTATANSEMENAQNQWQSQAPYVFENLQAVDETRLNHLRDVLTQFQTHEVDTVEKSRVTAESCLNVLLNVETADEIKAFVIRTSEGRPPTSRDTSTPVRQPYANANSSNLDLPGEEPSRQRSGSTQQDKPAEKEKKGPLKGLKRLGTVMGRRRESKMPAQLPSVSDSPERKQSRPSALNSFSSRIGRNRDTQILEPPTESPGSRRPSSPLRMGSEAMEPPQQSQELPSPSARDLNENVNGTSTMPENVAPPTSAPQPSSSYHGDLAGLEPPKASQPTPATQAGTEPDADGFSSPSQSLDPITQAQQEAAAEGGQPQFNVNIRNDPIQEEGGDADNALQSMAQKLQMVSQESRGWPGTCTDTPQQAPPTQRRLGTVRGRREARNSAVVAPDLGPQTSSTPPPIASPVAETPALSPPTETPAIPEVAENNAQAFSSPSLEAPRQAQNGSFPIPLASGAPGADSQPQPVYRPMSPRGGLGSDNTGGDNQSIRSGRSLSSTTSQANRHPELHATGLNSSIIETISARFENGQLTSSSIIGEVALAYNAPSFSSPFGTETIRLENFSGLDKVAPNPAFIIQTPGKEGEYSVDLSTLSRTQVAFKYQLRADDTTGTTNKTLPPPPPLLLTPAFRIEPTQTSVIVNYSLNPALHSNLSTLTLTNVTLAITLEGAKASSCQSKPVGTFAREKNLIYWHLGDVVLKAGEAAGKLLARFATEGEAGNGSVEARWEIGGEQVLGVGSGMAVSVLNPENGGAKADPFADEEGNGGEVSSSAGEWRGVSGVRKCVSGSYVAKR